MTTQEVSRSELIQLDRTDGPALGFSILRAVAHAATKADYQLSVKQYQGGFAATLRINSIDMRFSGVENNAVVTVYQYNRVLLKATAQIEKSQSDLHAVMSEFTSHFMDFLASERMEPEPKLEHRICSFDHNGHHYPVKKDEDTDLWWCQSHGLNYEEDTRLAPVNPFIL